MLSPSVTTRHNRLPNIIRNLLPATIQIHTRVLVPRAIIIDTRLAGECILLVSSLLFIISKLPGGPMHASSPDAPNWTLPPQLSFVSTQPIHPFILELYLLSAASFLYIVWAHTTSPSPLAPASSSPAMSSVPLQPPLVKPPEAREPRRHSTPLTAASKNNLGFIWMSVPKNYRESLDDGIVVGLLFGPIISSALLYSALQQMDTYSVTSPNPLPQSWRIEPAARLSNSRSPSTPLEALVLSRYNLVDLSTFCSAILLFHVCASWWFEARCRRYINAPTSERCSVPRSEVRRTWYYALFVFGVSLGMVCIRVLSARAGLGLWQHMNYYEVTVSSLFFQFTLYVGIRLAHGAFTLGELGLVSFGGTALCMELLNLTIARIWPVTIPFIKTYRLPTPLLIFQMALIAGSLLTGFLLFPLLVLSRHIAQRPVRKLRFPQERQIHRKGLALGFYVGAVAIIGGLIGMWTRWCLGNRDPWIWAIFWLLEGRKKWSRPLLLAYWFLVGSISVAGWNRQLARFRRYRRRDSFAVPNPTDNNATPSTDNNSTTPISGSLGLTFPNLPNLPNSATDLLDAADKRVPTLGLNARRKFFHALAVVMFLPGVAFDPAFAHLSFSAAFALFTFAEYVRYFAIYPFNAFVHLFMNDFLDHKDQGTAILSHFYLLTGCAGSVWLEGHSELLQYTGILAVGVGDALASIIGRRIGKHRWSPTTSKTLEGSAALTLSVIVCAWALRLCGLAEPFSTTRYAVVTFLASVLEALSVQNDNLTLPLYMWSMLVVVGV